VRCKTAHSAVRLCTCLGARYMALQFLFEKVAKDCSGAQRRTLANCSSILFNASLKYAAKIGVVMPKMASPRQE
jgi:hypothetical protein